MTKTARTPRPSSYNAEYFRSICRSVGLPDPVTEHVFAADIGRRWRLDFLFEQNGTRCALEVEGGIFKRGTAGRHNRPAGFRADCEKYNELAARGILLVRVLPEQLCTHKTLDTLSRVFAKK